MIIDKRFFKKLFNKWTIPIVLFLLYILFNGDHSVLTNMRHKAELKELKKQESYLKQKITNDKRRINELQSDQKNLEKFAREQFYMHKDNEDVFIVVEDENKTQDTP
ncbi:MAG: FtsB family cell division protein [Mangrovibacterium sp.]